MIPSTLHDVQAICPDCGWVRTLQIFAPPEKVEMMRLCDGCQRFPRRDRPTTPPYKDSE